MLEYPNIDPVALALGPVRIHWYGIMYVVGFAAAWWLARRQAARPGSTWKAAQVDDMIFWAMLGVIVGGRIGYVLLYVLPYTPELLREDWLYPVKIHEGGMSFHGGLLGTILALMLYGRSQGRRMLDVLDFCAPLPGIGIFAVRVGNFINNELWGAPTDFRWGFLVPDPTTGELIGRHATQLYEAALEGLALALLLYWFARRPRPAGVLLGLGLLWYGTVRFLVEFIRLPDLQIGYLAGDWFTMGQLLSLPLILIGAGLMLRAAQRPRPSGNYAAA
ncbi:MAG TPA: prolipoprotein diacylglyceryl transferase [Steroidobacteraceae bacterium]|nr:prolipoprotein diacylglyceryl transferase [Steroidobacteraceae bacterium]